MINCILAYFVFLVLSTISAIHIYWGIGGYWPADSRANLVRTVVGTEHRDMPSLSLTLLVSIIFFLIGLVPIFWLKIVIIPIDRGLLDILIILLGIIFTVRGFVTYTTVAVKYSTVEPFTTLNRRYYSPLCLVIAICFVIIRFF